MLTLRALYRPQCSGKRETGQWQGDPRASDSLGHSRAYRYICQENGERDQTSGRGQVRRYGVGGGKGGQSDIALDEGHVGKDTLRDPPRKAEPQARTAYPNYAKHPTTVSFETGSASGGGTCL